MPELTPYRRKVIQLVRTLNQRDMLGVELGVQCGALSMALLRAFPGLHLVMVDMWAEIDPATPYWQTADPCARLSQAEHTRHQTMAENSTYKWRDRRTIMRSSTADAAEFMRNRPKLTPIDFVFIDADHSYEGARSDLNDWWPLVRTGGLFLGHDYGYHPNGHAYGVSVAVDEFFKRLGRGFSWDSTTVWWVWK